MASPRDKSHRRFFLLRLLGTVIAFGVVAFLVWQNWLGFLDALRRLPLKVLLVVLFLAFLSRIMVTLRWYVLLRVVENDVSFLKVLRLSFVGLFTTNVLPSTIGGDFVKLGGAVQIGLDPAGVTASLLIDRLLGMATMATFLPVGLIRITQSRTMSSTLGAGSFGLFFLKTWQKFRKFIEETWDSIKLWEKAPDRLIFAAIFSYIHMSSTFTIIMVILNGLGEPISWWTAGGLWVLVYFITLIPISINGLGLQEVSLSLIYASFAGVSESNSLVLALLIRLVFMIASLPGAFFLPSFLTGDKGLATGVEMENLKNV